MMHSSTSSPPPTYVDATCGVQARRPARPLPAIPRHRPSFLELVDSPLSPESAMSSSALTPYSFTSSPSSSGLPPAYSPRVRECNVEKGVQSAKPNYTSFQPVEISLYPPAEDVVSTQSGFKAASTSASSDRYRLPPAPKTPPPPPPALSSYASPSTQPIAKRASTHLRSLSLPLVQTSLEPTTPRTLSMFSPVSPASALSVECIAPSSPSMANSISPIDNTRPSSFVPPPAVPPIVPVTPCSSKSKHLAPHSAPCSMRMRRADEMYTSGQSSKPQIMPPTPARSSEHYFLPGAQPLRSCLPESMHGQPVSSTSGALDPGRRTRTPEARPPSIKTAPPPPLPHSRSLDYPTSAPAHVPNLPHFPHRSATPSTPNVHGQVSRNGGIAIHDQVVTDDGAVSLNDTTPSPSLPEPPYTAGMLTFTERPILGSFRIRNRNRTMTARSASYAS